MTYPRDKLNHRPTDDGGLGMRVGIIAVFAVALVLGLSFWTLNDAGSITAMNAAPDGITTGIAPPTK